MSNFKLNLPTDIPWKRICVTEDMIDKEVCDKELPGKWRTSMAVFKYTPEDDYQLFPDYDISYLKVSATITGYQPLDKEIQGQIDWDGVDADTELTNEVLKDLLNSYHPCNGAILQVVVGPPGNDPDISVAKYPFFLDFEPKKRELYEMATETNERSSRSIESLNITKSAGSTQSLEILDIDMGGGGFGVEGSYAGTGGGFKYQAGNGQWGTKRINSDESLSSRSTDVGQEKRESYSFSTQLSQMYHLLDSYHIGTNRVVFFVQPRPHVLEEPSGFVRGPRPVEGMQEFFMVVAKPKEQDDFCVSLRLDTSHLTTTPIMDYDTKSVVSDIASASARVATTNDIPAERLTGEACFIGCWDVGYQCYRTDDFDNVVYNAPSGYRIEGFTDIINDKDHGNSSVKVSADGSSLSINAEAHGHRCVHDSGVCANCDDVQIWGGHARRQVEVQLRSIEPIKQIGEREVLMITTRGLCCCTKRIKPGQIDDLVVDIKPIPVELSVSHYLENFRPGKIPGRGMADLRKVRHDHKEGICKDCEDKIQHQQISDKPDTKYTIRLANELSNYIKVETIKSLNDPMVKPKKFHQTDFFAKQLEHRLVQFNIGKELLNHPVGKDIPDKIQPKLEKHFGKKVKDITNRDLLSLKAENLSKVTGLKRDEIQLLKLRAMGVKFTPVKSKNKSSEK